MEIWIAILSVLATAGAFATFVQTRSKKELEQKLKDPKFVSMSEDEAIAKASLKAKNTILEAEKEAATMVTKSADEVRNLRKQLKDDEDRLNQREKQIVQRSNVIDERFEQLESKEKSLEQAKHDVKILRQKIATQLEDIAKLTKEEAKEQLLKEVEEDLKTTIAKRIKEAEYEIHSKSEEKAREVIVDAMQKSATDYVAESTSTTIDIDNEELKGKIIGKEGRKNPTISAPSKT